MKIYKENRSVPLQNSLFLRKALGFTHTSELCKKFEGGEKCLNFLITRNMSLIYVFRILILSGQIIVNVL